MELKPYQWAAVGIALFSAIVGIQVLLEYQSNSEFRDKFKTRDFSSLRPRLLQQEGLEPEPQEQYVPEDEDEEA